MNDLPDPLTRFLFGSVPAITLDNENREQDTLESHNRESNQDLGVVLLPHSGMAKANFTSRGRFTSLTSHLRNFRQSKIGLTELTRTYRIIGYAFTIKDAKGKICTFLSQTLRS